MAGYGAGYGMQEEEGDKLRRVLHIVFQVAGEHIRGTGAHTLQGKAMECGE